MLALLLLHRDCVGGKFAGGERRRRRKMEGKKRPRNCFASSFSLHVYLHILHLWANVGKINCKIHKKINKKNKIHNRIPALGIFLHIFNSSGLTSHELKIKHFLPFSLELWVILLAAVSSNSHYLMLTLRGVNFLKKLTII